jgi:hypothetical protein
LPELKTFGKRWKDFVLKGLKPFEDLYRTFSFMVISFPKVTLANEVNVKRILSMYYAGKNSGSK